MKPKVVVIVGPTGAGKSALGVLLAKKFSGEIVSADSRQIYKELDIGTAKPIGKWQIVNGKSVYISDGVVHHMIDEVDPKEEFTLVDFKRRAEESIEDTLIRDKLPIIVGGSAQYIYALLENWQIPEIPPNPAFRKRLEKLSVEELDKKLREIDPEEADTADMNLRRIIRALEMYESTHRKPSDLKTKGEPRYDSLKLGVSAPDNYEEIIEKRVEKMFGEGLEEEFETISKEYSSDLPALQTIGYQEFKEEGDVKKKIIQSTLRFSKRQMTWFKRDKEIHWVNNADHAEELVAKYMI